MGLIRPAPTYVIDFRSVARTLGALILALSAAMLLPLGWSLYLGGDDWPVFGACILVLSVPGLLLTRLQPESKMRLREALLIVSVGWVVCASAGAFPFILTGSVPTFVDALFESMSGLTTTGATVVKDIEGLPPGIMYWRSLLHWLGGLGIIVIFLALLPQVGLGGTQLFQAEVPGPQVQRLRPKLRETAKVLLWIYLALTAAQTLALTAAGMSFFEAQIHTFGTIATGGFSSRADSIGAFDSALIEAIIIAFMVAAGTSFTLYYRAVFLSDRGVFLRDREIRWYLGLMALATAVVTVSLLRGPGGTGLMESLRHGFFQVVSILTTTGYVTADFDAWPETPRLVLLLLMFVGASAGSTGGAIKIKRWVILGRHIYREIIQTIHPAAVLTVTHGEEVVPESLVRRVAAFVGLYLLLFVLGAGYMTWLGLDLISSISASAATIGNIGPGLGSVGPMLDYEAIPQSGKVVLSLFMLLGRLELLTVLAVLTPAFWRR